MSEEVSMEEQTHTFEKNSTNDVGFRDEILEQLQKQQGPAEEEESKVSEEREKRIRDENQNTIESQNTTEDEKRDIDSRSIYIGNVDYGATPLELQQHFSIAGVVNRVTILMNKFTGQPKGFAYLEFADIEAVNKAVATLDGSVFRDRDLKVSAKRTNLPGFSTTNRGGFSRGRGRGFHRGGFRGRGRGRGNRFSPY